MSANFHQFGSLRVSTLFSEKIPNYFEIAPQLTPYAMAEMSIRINVNSYTTFQRNNFVVQGTRNGCSIFSSSFDVLHLIAADEFVHTNGDRRHRQRLPWMNSSTSKVEIIRARSSPSILHSPHQLTLVGSSTLHWNRRMNKIVSFDWPTREVRWISIFIMRDSFSFSFSLVVMADAIMRHISGV